MAYKINFTKGFKKNVDKCRKRGYDMNRLTAVLEALSETGSAPASCRPHKLVGDYKGKWECHIAPDWLLIWDQNDTELILLMLATGSHSDLL